MKNYKLFWITVPIAFIALGIAWLVYTHNEQKRRDHYLSFYSSVFMSAPCFADICPGFIGRKEAFEQLSNHPLVKDIQDRKYMTFLLVDGVSPNRLGYVEFSYNQENNYEVVNLINFNVFGLTLDEVIDILGEPEEILFIQGCYEAHWVYAKLLYPAKGVDVPLFYTIRQNQEVNLIGDMRVRNITYFSTNQYEEYVWNSSSHDVLNTSDSYISNEYLLQQIQPWSGFHNNIKPTINLCPPNRQ